jgi:hypothetical protein
MVRTMSPDFTLYFMSGSPWVQCVGGTR